jgi:hypothetical protein
MSIVNFQSTDDRFTKPHPRTVLWMAQRKKCEACTHCHQRRIDDGGGMWCAAMTDTPVKPYCIDMRDGTCGPEARLFLKRR